MAKIVYNDIIPFQGYKAMALYFWIFVRNSCKGRFTAIDSNHEYIHIEQQMELSVVGLVLTIALFLVGLSWWSLLALPIYLWWYILEYLIRIPIYGFSTNKAYKGISFEKEAYANETNLDYLRTRKRFCWLKYVFKK